MSAPATADLAARVAALERQLRDLRARVATLEHGPILPRKENPDDRDAVREKVSYDWQA
ncbi:MAG: hypothetical protein ACLPZM_03320 [Thermoplasmata archaeon]